MDLSSLDHEWAVRLHLVDLTPRQRERVVAAAGGLSGLERFRAPDFERAGLSPAAARELLALTAEDVPRELDRAQRNGAQVIVRADADYPPLLRESPDAPWALWVRGRLPPPERLTIAIVGSRSPTSYGLAVTRAIAAQAARAGAAILSGGARGVDGRAHEAALEEGAATVAVLGCGVDRTYPACHRKLFARLADEGGLVSEHPIGTSPRAHHFPVRNRILAGWARAVIVTEAAERSGSLITARLAVEGGREVMAVPGPITSPASAGCLELIARGARLYRDIRDLLAELPLEDVQRLAAAAPAGATARDPLLEALRPDRPLALEEIAAVAGIPVGRLLGELALLEAEGRARRVAGGAWCRT